MNSTAPRLDGEMIDIDGPVHLIDHGGSGPPMLMVHGLAGSHLDWSDVAPAFTRHHHVWSLDLIGFGLTPTGERRATVDANRRLVDAVIARVGEGRPVLLMGNSMGGLISILEASIRPDRVAGLVLVDPVLPRTQGGRLTMMVTVAFLVLAVPGLGGRLVSRHARWRGVERLVDDALRLCTVDATRINPTTRQANVELNSWRMEQDDPQRAFVEASRSLVRMLIRRRGVEPHLRAISAPTLLIHGDHDRLVGLRAAGWAASVRPDWEFRVLDSTGHVPQLERPREFITLVERWLQDARVAPQPPGQAPKPVLPTSRR